MLNKAELLNAMRLKTEVVKIEGGEVVVSEMGAADYIQLWSTAPHKEDGTIDMSKFTPMLVTYSVVDAENNRIFSDEDVEVLSRSASGPFTKLAAAARRVNGMAGDEAKNSKPSRADSSPSASA